MNQCLLRADRCYRRLLLCSCVVLAWTAPEIAAWAEVPGGPNLARTAHITSSSFYSADYEPSCVADGVIPAAQGHKDVGKAWCARGNRHDHGVTLTFQWCQSVSVVQLVYYGRTAWEWEENWKNYEVYADDAKQAIATGTLRLGHGPQSIRLDKPTVVTSLTLRFTSSYGGSNPGASEIEIFADPLPEQYFASFSAPAPQRRQPPTDDWAVSPVPEDAGLRADVIRGKLGFKQMVVVQRHAIKPTHVYTYHTEGQSPGGGLYLVDLAASPPAMKCLVDAGEGLVLDAELSYDGQTVLFSWKRTMADPLQLFMVGVDGKELRQITHDASNNLNACWLPDGGIAFLSDRNQASPRVATRPLAACRPAESLTPPAWGVTGFSYPAVVQPVLDQHCVRCHDALPMGGDVDLSGDKTDFFNVSYEYLARQGKPGENPYTKWIPTFNGQEANILQITPKYWGSPASRLADLILSGHPGPDGKPRVALSANEQRAVFTWIDLDVPYYGTSESNHYDVPGCRQMMPDHLDRVLNEVAARRCIGCHSGGVPRAPFVRITHADQNVFLLAPLGRAAGGTERCGQAVFASREDPDYVAILDCFRTLEAEFRQTPRTDMCP